MSEETNKENKINFFDLDGGKKTREITQERKNILKQMTTSLKTLGFTDDEINEVLDIINKAQDDVAYIKEELEGTNLNVEAEEAVYITRKKTGDIRAKNEKMAADIRAKISEIMTRKSGN